MTYFLDMEIQGLHSTGSCPRHSLRWTLARCTGNWRYMTICILNWIQLTQNDSNWFKLIQIDLNWFKNNEIKVGLKRQGDTFLDNDHILESFPDAEDIFVPENLPKPFRLSFEKQRDEPGKRPIERVSTWKASKKRCHTYFWQDILLILILNTIMLYYIPLYGILS